MKIKISELKKIIRESVQKKLINHLIKENLYKEDRVTPTTWGTIPSVEKLDELMAGEPFTMDLKGMDSLCWDYAMELSNNPLAGRTDTAKGLHASLEALMEVQNPELLSDEEYSRVEGILDRWYERYDDKEIEDHVYDLASSILGVLGVEWI